MNDARVRHFTARLEVSVTAALWTTLADQMVNRLNGLDMFDDLPVSRTLELPPMAAFR